MVRGVGAHPSFPGSIWAQEDGPGLAHFPGAGWEDVDTGAWHTCGILDGRVYCWGADYYGQSSEPSGWFSDVATGYHHSCAISSAGIVQCWGDDGYGQSTVPSFDVCPGVFMK